MRSTFFILLVLSAAVAGCTQSYPADRIAESIQEICRKEYGIENIQVKIKGKTVGVYLPIQKLFAEDFREAFLKGSAQVSDVENLFRPSPEALEQVEDVLFSISRVLLSTDLKLQFYLLQATDVEQTGLQMVLAGYVDDIKRVRLWDISRDEYRKRVLHEIRLNRAAIWHRPVRSFFKAFEASPSLETVNRFLSNPVTAEDLESLFFLSSGAPLEGLRWELGELRSLPVEKTRILVHVQVRIDYDPEKVSAGAVKVPPKSALEYFFIVSFLSDRPEILRIIPLSFVDEGGKVQRLSLVEEFNVEEDLEAWATEFSFSEISLGDFLANQLTRRLQALLFKDERVHHTFEALELTFHYHEDEEATAQNYFSFDLETKLQTRTPWAPPPTILHEDILYVLELASREFVDVARSYRFNDYEFLELNLASDPVSRTVGREDLELFRRGKVDLAGLLNL